MGEPIAWGPCPSCGGCPVQNPHYCFGTKGSNKFKKLDESLALYQATPAPDACPSCDENAAEVMRLQGELADARDSGKPDAPRVRNDGDVGQQQAPSVQAGDSKDGNHLAGKADQDWTLAGAAPVTSLDAKPALAGAMSKLDIIYVRNTLYQAWAEKANTPVTTHLNECSMYRPADDCPCGIARVIRKLAGVGGE